MSFRSSADETRLQLLRLRGEIERQALRKAATDLGERAHELRGLGVLSKIAGLAAAFSSRENGAGAGHRAEQLASLLRRALGRAGWLPLLMSVLRIGLRRRWGWAAVGTAVVATAAATILMRPRRPKAPAESTSESTSEASSEASSDITSAAPSSANPAANSSTKPHSSAER